MSKEEEHLDPTTKELDSKEDPHQLEEAAKATEDEELEALQAEMAL